MATSTQRHGKTTTKLHPPRRVAARPSPARTAKLPVRATPTTAAPIGAVPLTGGLPIGLGTAALAADVSGQLKTVAPTFGQVLRSIGIGVAQSQTALDKGIIDTVTELATTNITVVTDVIQHLNDDGEPDPAATELLSTDLSVLNFFMPTVHEWKRVAVSMDLSVGAFSEKDGVTFNAKQSGFGFGTVGLFWGFVGVGEIHDYDHVENSSRSHQQESSWSQGEVRLDATLGPRTTQAFPIPTQVTLGPQIVFSQGTITETPVAGAGVNRSIDVLVTVLTHAGAVNPGKAIVVDAGKLRVAFSSTAPFSGSTTNAKGQISMTITRNVPNAGAAAIKVPVSARLASFSQNFSLTI